MPHGTKTVLITASKPPLLAATTTSIDTQLTARGLTVIHSG
ncbi:hypothetical protein N644_0122 [Lactiplantibacillus paraplantarum]|nr:hypothetical protein N644_0122 [Lactiplantibacillus paraplantarum]